ncbi:MAG: FHA domain-containing protein [Polyangiaceae bacterium]|nr:FHA domain-containing protein [Myxococcales bacterium]MCB9584205.1 FHA domain-containing protein [Polyangiaceae bacterium]MCB9608633.1 FHA domain-containing protein [Polyangiaceae bacterium]
MTTSLVRDVEATADASRGERAVRLSPTKQWVFQCLFDEQAPRRTVHVAETIVLPTWIGRRGGTSKHTGPRLELDDPHVSGEHACVTPTGDGLLVEDQHSRNGVWLDGERVAQCLLRPGDLLRIGRSLATCAHPDDLGAPSVADGLIGGSSFREVRLALDACAQSTAHVLVVGPSGSGKRAFAHALARRQGRAWTELDPTRIPPRLLDVELFGNQRVRGALRSSGEGALYITRCDKLTSGQLARLVEEAKAPGTRLLFGVPDHSPLLADAALTGAPRVTLPMLAERRHDIPALISSVIPRGLIGIQVEFVEACYFESWPGHVGQLLRTVRDAVARAVAEREGAVGPRHLVLAEAGGAA